MEELRSTRFRFPAGRGRILHYCAVCIVLEALLFAGVAQRRDPRETTRMDDEKYEAWGQKYTQTSCRRGLIGRGSTHEAIQQQVAPKGSALVELSQRLRQTVAIPHPPSPHSRLVLSLAPVADLFPAAKSEPPVACRSTTNCRVCLTVEFQLSTAVSGMFQQRMWKKQKQKQN